MERLFSGFNNYDGVSRYSGSSCTIPLYYGKKQVKQTPRVVEDEQDLSGFEISQDPPLIEDKQDHPDGQGKHDDESSVTLSYGVPSPRPLSPASQGSENKYAYSDGTDDNSFATYQYDSASPRADEPDA